MSENQTPQHIEDESELDAILEESINSVKAGQTITEETPKGQTGAEEEPDEPQGVTGSEDTSGEKDGDSHATDVPGDEQIKIPEKGKFESDEAYEKRVELAELVRQRKAATTPEAKEALSERIKSTRKEIGRADMSGRFTQPKVENVPSKDEEDLDPLVKQDLERAKQLGLATPEDIQVAIQQERFQQSVQDTIANFVDKHNELADEDAREVFFDFVDQNFIWQGKTGKELATVLSLAKEAMFKPAETIKERALKASDLDKKIGVMQFPGGTGSKSTYSPEFKQSLEELKSTGMSEEKALQLLSDE